MADEPIYDLTTERMYHRLPETFRMADRGQGYALKRYVRGMCAVEAELDLLSARFDRLDVIERAAKLDSPYSNYLRQHLVVQRTNLTGNPDFDAANGTTEVRRNLVPNPAFRTLSPTPTEVRRNYVTNPAFRAVSGTVEARRNLLLNPAFKAATAAVEVRRNLATDPSCEIGGAGGWSTNNGTYWTASNDSTHFHSGTKSRKSVAAAGQVGFSQTILSLYNVGGGIFPVTAGKTYTASIYLDANVAANGFITANFLDAGGAAVGVTLAGSSVAISAGDDGWFRSVLTAVAPVGATQIRLGAVINRAAGTGNTTATDIAWADDCLLEEFGVLLPYFDGSTAASDGLTYSWTGAANASPAIASGMQVTGWVTSVGLKKWQGADGQSIRVLYDGVASNLVLGPATTPVTTGDQIMWSIEVSSADVGSIYLQHFPSGGTGDTTSNSPVIATGPVSARSYWASKVVTDSTTDQTWVRFTNGMPGDYTFRKAMIEKSGAMQYPYFDGTTAAGSGLTYSWTGTANASASIATGNKPAGYPTQQGAAGYATDENLFQGRPAMRVAWLGAYSTLGAYVGGMSITGLVIGATYVASVWLWMGPGASASLPHVRVSGLASGTQPVTEGQWVQSVVTFVATSTTHVLHPVANGAATSQGQWTLVRDFILERADTVTPYFDGATLDADGLDYAWTGTADASQSVATGLKATGYANNDPTYFSPWTLPDPDGIGNISRMVIASANNSPFAPFLSITPRIPVTPGQVVTFSFEARNFGVTAGRTMRMMLYPVDSGGNLMTPVTALGTTALTTGWTRYVGSFTVPDGAVSMSPYMYPSSGPTWQKVIDGIDLRRFVIEIGCAMGTYFDGETIDANDLTYSWDGVADASASVADGVQIATWENAYLGKTIWQGNNGTEKTAKILNPGVLAYTAAQSVIYDLPNSLQQDDFVAKSFKVRSLSGSNINIQFALRAYQVSGTALSPDLTDTTSTTLPGNGDWVDISIPALNRAPANANYIGLIIRAGSGGWVGGEMFEIDKMITEKVDQAGSGTGEFFTGNSTPTHDNIYGWEGDPNLSFSTMSMMTAYTEDEEAALGWTPIDLTSDLVDPVTADAAWLNWLGQLVGVNTDTLLSEQERRDAVQFASSGFHAGSQTALEDAARSELTGTRYVRVYTHSTDDMAGIGTGTEWDILLVTKTSETPSVAQVVDTVIRKGAKPAGVRLYHKAYEVPWSISDTMDWDDRDALTWDEYEETGVV